MNYLSIDYGSKRVGLAFAINGVIATLPAVANDQKLIPHLREIIDKYQISKIYIGLSYGHFALVTLEFVKQLQGVLELPVETVEEAVSTIEADEIFEDSRVKKQKYRTRIDSIAAAVILRRVIDSN